FIGSTSLTKLGLFLLGYEHAVYRLMPDKPDRFLTDFREWIYRRFKTRDNISWEGVILRECADEQAAVERFWELLDEYLQQRPTPGTAAVPVSEAHGAAPPQPVRPARP